MKRDEVSGVVTLLARRGEVHRFGRDDGRRRQRLVRHDALFRITSMTKPATAAAAMIMVEECWLRLDEPVDGLLPDLSGRRVLRRLDGPGR